MHLKIALGVLLGLAVVGCNLAENERNRGNVWVWTTDSLSTPTPRVYMKGSKTNPENEPLQQQNQLGHLEEIEKQEQQQLDSIKQETQKQDIVMLPENLQQGVQIPSDDCIPIPEWLKRQINQHHLETTGMKFFKNSANVHGCIKPPTESIKTDGQDNTFIHNDCVNIILPEWLLASLDLSAGKQDSVMNQQGGSLDGLNQQGQLNQQDNLAQQGQLNQEQQGQLNQEQQAPVIEDDLQQQQFLGTHDVINPLLIIPGPFPTAEDQQQQGGYNAHPHKMDTQSGSYPVIQREADSEEDVEFSCVEKELGYHADETRGCRYYYKCVKGWDKAFVFQCPSDLVFDTMGNICNNAEYVKCGKEVEVVEDLLGREAETEATSTTTKKPKFYKRLYNRFRNIFKDEKTEEN